MSNGDMNGYQRECRGVLEISVRPMGGIQLLSFMRSTAEVHPNSMDSLSSSYIFQKDGSSSFNCAVS